MFSNPKKIMLLFIGSLCIFALSHTQEVPRYLTDDGTWCWFSDPRAIMVDDQVVTGWVKSNGTIEAACLDPLYDSIQTSELYFILEADDHNNPAFVQTADGDILAMYTRHGLKDLFINTLHDTSEDFNFSGPQLMHPWSDEELQAYPRQTMTYANPVKLEAENNRIYCFGRWTGFKPNMMWSDDGGLNWSESRAWIADIAQDAQNNPVILYTRSPAETNHEYWYASYTPDGWLNHKIVDSGKWFPQTPEGQKEWEVHYFGGMSLHPGNPGVVYLSRQVNGVFEIERWETTDRGVTWSTEAITTGSEFDNVRPVIPRGLTPGSDEIILWMENQKYIHYTNYRTSVRYLIRD